MNIYRICIKDEKDEIVGIYFGEADTAEDAIDKSCMVALNELKERRKKLIVVSCIRQGEKSF